MVSCQNVFVLLFGWCYLSCGCCFMLDSYLTRLKSKTEAGRFEKTRAGDQSTKDEKYLILRETVSEHMQVLYMKYNKTGFHFKDGNTVRSFAARWGTINSMELQVFNLSSLTKSEDILSATLHFYVGNIRSTNHRCVTRNTCRRHDPRKAHVQLGIWSFAPFDNNTRTLGHININVSKHNRDITKWKYNDITRIVQQAKHHNDLLVGIDVSLQGCRLLKSISYPPSYILVYANDSAVFGPESVVSTLRRHKAPLDPQVDFPRTWNSSTERRTRRSANILLPLQNNELPGNEYPYEDPRWDENDPYQSLDNHHAKRSRQKTPKTHRHKMPLLKFDDQTIKKARKKQWIEPLNCARRNLKVDFADIGWSEWIISPKSFDAYYCSGSCQFPMPKSVKPSNHATIQSIVRAVGVVPGIPEPGCVPERMSSLSILFFDQDKNVVLKVYPNMTVDSCVCR